VRPTVGAVAKDAEDVRTRLKDSLAHSAARAYRAANAPPSAEARGYRFRLDAVPAVALAGVLVLALVFTWLSLRPTDVPMPEVSVIQEDRDLAGVVIHVTGAVANPGVVSLEGGARVADAIEAVGGLAQDADQSAINLARIVTDGEQVYVPVVGETNQGMINLNRAGATELDALPGIGPALADRIVADRDQNGPFGSVDDLDRVSGIGESVISKIASLATV